MGRTGSCRDTQDSLRKTPLPPLTAGGSQGCLNQGFLQCFKHSLQEVRIRSSWSWMLTIFNRPPPRGVNKFLIFFTITCSGLTPAFVPPLQHRFSWKTVFILVCPSLLCSVARRRRICIPAAGNSCSSPLGSHGCAHTGVEYSQAELPKEFQRMSKV